MRQREQDIPLDVGRRKDRLSERSLHLKAGRACRICENAANSPSAKFCIICGNFIQQPGRVKEMLYKAIRLSEGGKAVICPHCDNEELTAGDFCMICGSNIVNRCADTRDPANPESINKSCRTILTGNARYCPKCGNESTFYQRGWLRDWRSENTKRAIENINMTLDISELHRERKPG